MEKNYFPILIHFLFPFLCFFPALVQPASAGDAEGKKPQMACDKMTFDFGTVKPGETVSHTFEIHNSGTASLKVNSVRLLCSGCLEATIDKKEIPPGETALLQVTFKPEKSAAGKDVKKTVILSSNDPNRPVCWFRLLGKVAAGADNGKNEKTEDPEPNIIP